MQTKSNFKRFTLTAEIEFGTPEQESLLTDVIMQFARGLHEMTVRSRKDDRADIRLQQDIFGAGTGETGGGLMGWLESQRRGKPSEVDMGDLDRMLRDAFKSKGNPNA